MIVQCQRVADNAHPVAGSVAVECAGCQVPIWFHAGDLAFGFVDARCPDCVPRGRPLMFTPGQVDALRSRGLDDDAIARMLAIARMTDGNPNRVPAFADQVAADPAVAHRFAETITTAAADLAEVYGQ